MTPTQPFGRSGHASSRLIFGAWALSEATLKETSQTLELLLEWLMARQNAQGQWTCGSVSRTWQLERRGQPSKWDTLDARRVLRLSI